MPSCELTVLDQNLSVLKNKCSRLSALLHQLNAVLTIEATKRCVYEQVINNIENRIALITAKVALLRVAYCASSHNILQAAITKELHLIQFTEQLLLDQPVLQTMIESLNH